MNAVLLTFSTAASLLFALKTRIIQVTDRFADTVSALSLLAFHCLARSSSSSSSSTAGDVGPNQMRACWSRV
jgi:hypothetical protein